MMGNMCYYDGEICVIMMGNMCYYDGEICVIMMGNNCELPIQVMLHDSRKKSCS